MLSTIPQVSVTEGLLDYVWILRPVVLLWWARGSFGLKWARGGSCRAHPEEVSFSCSLRVFRRLRRLFVRCNCVNNDHPENAEKTRYFQNRTIVA